MKKAIIIGASSGIGKELAKILSEDGYSLGLAARRVELLKALQGELKTDSMIKPIDLAQPGEAIKELNELIQTMGNVDLLIISSGTGHLNPELDWDKEKATLDVNVTGFAAAANVALKYFLEQGRGHLVGISSIAALRGSRHAPAYNASKAFVSNYLEGLRSKVRKAKADIAITDIQPGLVDTAMAQGEGLFWVAPPEKAARQIYQKIKRRKTHAYITKRWGIIAVIMKYMPGWIYEKL